MNKIWITIIAASFLLGIGIWGIYSKTDASYNLRLPNFAKEETKNFHYGSIPELSNINYFNEVEEQLVAEKVSFIEANLSEMKLRVYKEGVVVKEVPILTKGKEGSWWETPAGIYKIEAKVPNHFSSIGKVYQPWSMVFQGNFFIHGWPYYEGGKDVASTYSGGCIRLSTEDAKAVYEVADIGMPVLVFEKDFEPDSFRYQSKSPQVTASKYLMSDLGNGAILAEKESEAVVPIASITKLVSALVATDYIHIEKNLTVSEKSIASTSKPRLIPGQEITVYNLLFPMLMESSNEASNVIADSLGRKYFVNLMNKKAKSINMKDTIFADPSGSESGNVSSAKDLVELSRYILNNRKFIFNITAGKVSFATYGEPIFSSLGNYNIVPGLNSNFIGGKIGKTTAAGETYLGVFEETISGEKRKIAIVLLDSKDVYSDVIEMIDYLREMYQK